jgi:hypothetical protein
MLLHLPFRQTYDVLGCDFNAPANYDDNVFESCQGADAEDVSINVARTRLTKHAEELIFTVPPPPDHVQLPRPEYICSK